MERGFYEKKEENMKCIDCQNKLSVKSIPYSVTRNGYDVILHDIPALICDRCGEVFFAEKSVSKIQEMIDNLDRTSKEVRNFKIDYPFAPF